MKQQHNLYQQQIDDFLCRARRRLGELTAAGTAACDCTSSRSLIGDLYAAIRTLKNCHSCLTWAEKLQLVQAVTSRAQLATVALNHSAKGVVVRKGTGTGGSGTGSQINLPLTGEQVTVRVNGKVERLQSVITNLYNQQPTIKSINGGSAMTKF